MVLQACKTIPPIARPGPVFDGSAKWALNIAQPLISKFATDAQIYCIIGEDIHKDGRLYTNIGTWTFLTWSPSQQKVFEVTVKHDGTASNTTRNEVSPTPPNNGQAISSGWINSTDIFAATAPYLVGGITHANLAVLNVGNNPQALNQTVWSINFDKGKRHLVKSDGTHVGVYPDPYYLISPFLRRDPNVHRIMNGSPYNMDDPAWLINVSYQNRNVFAYKLFAALHMLGYETGRKGVSLPPDYLRVLNKFQKQNVLPVANLVTSDCIKKLDSLLIKPELLAAFVGRKFPLYNHMQPLHYHDISKDFLAMIYILPMNVLPKYLQMSEYEMVQCIAGNCLGFIQDGNGNDWPTYPVDITKDYRFVGAYFDPQKAHSFLPSASIIMQTVLHEYAHYLDSQGTKDPTLPNKSIINTWGFYNISYDMDKYQASCAPRKSNDPKDWITKYGFTGSSSCPSGMYHISEEWAEAFATYVVAGKNFRTAAKQNVTIDKKYNWLKTNVFQAIEYDTDLPGDLHSGCNDIPGTNQAQPGYVSCSEDYVWDGELRIK